MLDWRTSPRPDRPPIAMLGLLPDAGPLDRARFPCNAAAPSVRVEWQDERRSCTRSVHRPCDGFSMSSLLEDDFRQLARRLREASAKAAEPAIAEPLESLKRASLEIGEAWSGSSIGYHARVYYDGFNAPPAG